MKIAISTTATLVTMAQQNNKDKELPSSQPFPSRLFTMLEESQNRGFEDVISWQSEGESFRVYKPDRFAAEIAGDFFALRKYKSFLRQLNIYGFQRIHHGPNKGGYSHPLFKRTQPAMVKLISRQGEAQRPAPRFSEESSTALSSATQLELTSRASNESSAVASQVSARPRAPSVDAAELDPVKLLFSLASERRRDTAGSLTLDSRKTAASSHVNFTGNGSVASHPSREQEHSFPWKLHTLLEEAEREGFTSIVSWMQGGTAFKVHDSDAFVSRLMPNFFDQSKYESFRRQLNLYGFSRVTRGTNKGFISHPYFVRHNRVLCRNITRKGKEDVGGTKERPKESASEATMQVAV